MADDQTTDTSANADQTDTADDDTGADGQSGNADGLRSALHKEREFRKNAEKQARQASAELEQLRKQSMTDAEKAVAQAKEEGKAEALATANQRLVKAEVRAAAAGKLADPSLAVKLLDLDQFQVGDDGDIDDKALGKAIDQLVKEYPALAKTPAGAGHGDGGARNGSSPPNFNDVVRDRMRRR